LRIFGPERDEMTGGWRKPHNEELHNFAKHDYSDEVGEDEMGRTCSTNGGEKDCI
jgi:hypothetical protein